MGDSGSYTCSSSACPTTCSRGEYLSFGTCTDCPAGKYQDDSSHTESWCTSCPRGKSSLPRSDSANDCIAAGLSTESTGFGSFYDADTGQTLYYESADAAQQHLEDAGDALGDAVCDAIAEYGCNAHPECCGAVRSHLDFYFAAFAQA